MVLSCGQYKTMDSAPTDGNVILVLTTSKYPRAAYWNIGTAEWLFWHTSENCNPVYWADLPADVPAGFFEDELSNPYALTVEYQPIATAAIIDDSRVLVLVNPSDVPILGYYDAGWKADSDASAIVPEYWAPVPPLPVGYP